MKSNRAKCSPQLRPKRTAALLRARRTGTASAHLLTQLRSGLPAFDASWSWPGASERRAQRTHCSHVRQFVYRIANVNTKRFKVAGIIVSLGPRALLLSQLPAIHFSARQTNKRQRERRIVDTRSERSRVLSDGNLPLFAAAAKLFHSALGRASKHTKKGHQTVYTRRSRS